MSIKSDIKKIAKGIEKLIKDDITSKRLIDTGAMRKNIKVVVTIDGNGFDFFLDNPVTYFKFVDGEFDILIDVFASRGFARIEDDILEVQGKIIEKEIRKKFK